VSTAWFDIVSGARKGVGASLARAGLRLLSVPYRAAVGARRFLYCTGIRRTKMAPMPVVSVGNLTVGGTGKTPLVEYLARGLVERGRAPAIVMRGYAPKKGAASDEAALLRVNLAPLVPVIEEPDRYLGALRARRESGADVVILDDGFQHLRLHRDLDIVTLDATHPFGFDRLFPAGCLREKPEALARAGVIVVTRTDLAEAEDLDAVMSRLARLAPEAIVATSTFRPAALEGGGVRRDVSELRGLDVAVFCGIGNPHAFVTSLKRLGARVVATRRFADHHAFTRDDLAAVAAEAKAKKAALVLTTQKDASRIADGAWPVSAPPLCVVRANFQVTQGEAALWRAVEDAARAKAEAE
jgi:tetraacyldisaccharide 4'-kinase